MKTYRALFLSLMIAVIVVMAGCQSAEPVQEIAQPETQAPVEPADGELAEAPGAQPGRGDFSGLNDSSLLAMGTMSLEGTGDAVTSEQAAKLLPLWTVIQSGSLQGAAETDAVMKQIRGQMTDEQLAAIETLGLTTADFQAWLQEQGIEVPGMGGDGQPPAGAPEGAGDMSEEDRAAMREQFQSMTEDERATAMAESGMERPEGGAAGRGGGGGFGSSNAALQPLIDLLTERAAE